MSRWQFIVCLFFIAGAGAAQAQPRDYSISLPRVHYSADGASAVITFTVRNQGGDAVDASQIIIAENQSGRVEFREPLPALAAGQEQPFSLELPLTLLPEDDLFFKVEAGIDQYELAGSPIARNNTQLFRLNKADASASTGTAPNLPAAPTYDLFIPVLNLGLNVRADGLQVNDRLITGRDLLLAAGLAVVALFCLWLLSLILRLIFRRPPKFEPWQPPYAVNTWYDPNSAIGRRQGWQFHAQNSTISVPRVLNQVTVTKRLLDRQDTALGSWRIKALRTVQYDIYGRINRSEVIMPQTINRQLNRIARRAPSLDNPALRKAIAPIAKRLSKYALAAVEKQNLMLPLALDIRLEGDVADVRILFELYQCRDDTWHLIDSWEPELGQIGARVPEQLTFTLNGQLPGESNREFKARLQEDVAQLLASLFYHHQAEAGADESNAQRDTASLAELLDGERAGLDDDTDAR